MKTYILTVQSVTKNLASGSISDVLETCVQCSNLFENELDLKQHKERVHEYGEVYELYPCEDFGFRGTDVSSLRKYIEE